MEDFSKRVDAAGGRLPGKNRLNPFEISANTDFEIADSVTAELSKWSSKLL
jgi:hypothetical protein